MSSAASTVGRNVLLTNIRAAQRLSSVEPSAANVSAASPLVSVDTPLQQSLQSVLAARSGAQHRGGRTSKADQRSVSDGDNDEEEDDAEWGADTFDSALLSNTVIVKKKESAQRRSRRSRHTQQTTADAQSADDKTAEPSKLPYSLSVAVGSGLSRVVVEAGQDLPAREWVAVRWTSELAILAGEHLLSDQNLLLGTIPQNVIVVGSQSEAPPPIVEVELLVEENLQVYVTLRQRDPEDHDSLLLCLRYGQVSLPPVESDGRLAPLNVQGQVAQSALKACQTYIDENYKDLCMSQLRRQYVLATVSDQAAAERRLLVVPAPSFFFYRSAQGRMQLAIRISDEVPAKSIPVLGSEREGWQLRSRNDPLLPSLEALVDFYCSHILPGTGVSLGVLLPLVESVESVATKPTPLWTALRRVKPEGEEGRVEPVSAEDLLLLSSQLLAGPSAAVAARELLRRNHMELPDTGSDTMVEASGGTVASAVEAGKRLCAGQPVKGQVAIHLPKILASAALNSLGRTGASQVEKAVTEAIHHKLLDSFQVGWELGVWREKVGLGFGVG